MRQANRKSLSFERVVDETFCKLSYINSGQWTPLLPAGYPEHCNGTDFPNPVFATLVQMETILWKIALCPADKHIIWHVIFMLNTPIPTTNMADATSKTVWMECFHCCYNLVMFAHNIWCADGRGVCTTATHWDCKSVPSQVNKLCQWKKQSIVLVMFYKIRTEDNWWRIRLADSVTSTKWVAQTVYAISAFPLTGK